MITGLPDILHERNHHRWMYYLRRSVKAGGPLSWLEYEGLRKKKSTWSPGHHFLTERQANAYGEFFLKRKRHRNAFDYSRMRLALQ